MKDLNLRKICIEHLVFPRGITNPTLEQVIQAFEDRLQELSRNPAKDSGPWSGDYMEWKNKTDALKSQLTELRNAQKVGRGVPTAPPRVTTTPNNQSPVERTIERTKITPPQHPKSNQTTLNTATPPPSKKPDIQHISSSFSQKIDKNSPQSKIIDRHSSIINPVPSSSASSVPSVPSATSVINSPTPEVPTTPEIATTTAPEPKPNPQLSLARVLQSAAKRKSRPDDKFATLTEDDRQQLLAWLQSNSFDTVLELAAKPRPEGLDFHTSRTALHNFFHKQDLNDRLQTAIDILEAAEPASGGPNPLEQTLELLVHAQSVRTASAPNMNDRVLTHFLRHITRLRELQQRERAITIRQKSLAFRMQTQGYDLVAETLKKLPELNEIAANKNITPRQAFQKGFIKVFGQEAHDYIQECNRRYRELHPDEPDYDPTPETTFPETELTETEKFRLMCEFPDSTMSEIHAIAAERKGAGQPITLSGDDAIDRAVGGSKVGRAVPSAPLSATKTTQNYEC